MDSESGQLMIQKMDQGAQVKTKQSSKIQHMPIPTHGTNINPLEGWHVMSFHSPPCPINPVSVLHNINPGLAYVWTSQTGPSHKPTFTVNVELDGYTFIGLGQNKKEAKCNVAEKVIEFLQQHSPETKLKMNGLNVTIQNYQSEINPIKDKDSSSYFNITKSPMNLCTDDADGSQRKLSLTQAAEATESGLLKGSLNSNQPNSKHPVSLLNELRPGIKFEYLSESGMGPNQFSVELVINDQRFIGCGSSKKDARTAAAKAALANLFHVFYSVDNEKYFVLPHHLTSLNMESGLPQDFADHIGRLVHQKFAELAKNKSLLSETTVLSGIVMSRGLELKNAQVISFATGSSVRLQDSSGNGSALLDSHAEIVARRCLMDFILSQLEAIASGDGVESVFVPKPNGKGYKLKDDINFHLYITVAPCGDARMFSPYEKDKDCSIDDCGSPASKWKASLRVKVGEGTVPICSYFLKNFRKDENYSLVYTHHSVMSCSDKIMKWNVLGMQGAFLSHFVDPIYLKSVVVSSLFHPSHLYRALVGRVEKSIGNLPHPFILNKPLLSSTSSIEPRLPRQSPDSTVNWTVGQSLVEVICTSTGKKECGSVSRISKRCLFRRFNNLVGKIPSKAEINIFSSFDNYFIAKNSEAVYQMAKSQFFISLSAAGLGVWMKKPVEYDKMVLCDESINKIKS